MRNLGYLWQSYQLEALKTRRWTYTMRMWINDELYDSNDLFSGFKKDFKMFSEGFTLGSCPSGYFEFAARDKHTYIPKNSEVRFEIKISGERGDTEWFPFGTYFIDNRVVGKSTLTFQCYDRMLFADKPFWDTYVEWSGDPSAKSLRPVMKMSKVLTVIADGMSARLDPRNRIFNDPEVRIDADYTCREVLRDIAISNAGNFIITDEDTLRLLVLANDSGGSIESRNDFLVLTMSDSPQVLAVNPSNFVSNEQGQVEIIGLQQGLNTFEYPNGTSAFEYYDAVQLQALVMVFEEGGASDGEGEDEEEQGANYFLSGDPEGVPSLEVTNVFATQEICDSVYEAIRGYEYRGFNASTVILDPAIEIGDPIVLQNTFVNVINCSWYGVLASDLESPLSGNTTSEFPYKSSEARTFSKVIKKIKKVEVNLEVTADSIRASVEDLTDSSDQRFAELTLTAGGLDGLITQEIENRTQGDIALSNEFSVTASGIRAELTSEVTTRQSEVTRLEGVITTTASGIRADFSADIDDVYDAVSSVEIYADKIASRVQKNITASFTSTVAPTNANTSDAEKTMLCEYSGKKYYYDEYSGTWKVYPYSGLVTAFEQTGAGFSLTGDVTINGDFITEGTISGIMVRTAPSLAGDNVRLNSTNNSLELMYGTTVIGKWQMYDLGTSQIAPTGGGKLYLGNDDTGTSGGTTHALGSWDFSQSSIDWGTQAPVAIFG